MKRCPKINKQTERFNKLERDKDTKREEIGKLIK